jgi:hypothetical protein
MNYAEELGILEPIPDDPEESWWVAYLMDCDDIAKRRFMRAIEQLTAEKQRLENQNLALSLEKSALAESVQKRYLPARPEWSLGDPPAVGMQPIAYDAGDSWFLHWMPGDLDNDKYACEIDWPFEKEDIAWPHDLERLGFQVL